MDKVKKIGVIADDFTGASDAASFLSKSGALVIMCSEIPKHLDEPCDAIVVALKSRSVLPKEAVRQTKKAVDFLRQAGCEQFYFKYCSTFDSTPKGNIGVVLDFLLDYLGENHCVLCPSLPVNGRIVQDGMLYVNGKKLGESPMKDHPLNPMWDSFIPNLMKPQSNHECCLFHTKEGDEHAVKSLMDNHQEKYYIVPDYIDDEDGKKIAALFGEDNLLSGGSGLLQFLYKGDSHQKTENTEKSNKRAILLCGSCSQATKGQIDCYKASGGKVYAVNAEDLLSKKTSAEAVFDWVIQQESPVLIYSDAVYKDMQQLRCRSSFESSSKALEKFMAALSTYAVAADFDRIIVAGGETSGAVTKALGFDRYYIGTSIDPGVPILRPLQKQELTLILKSGNFGSTEFFEKAVLTV